jgi:hypothetical protein
MSTGELTIIRIDLNTSVDEYIRRHLETQSAETRNRIKTVIEERKIIEQARIIVEEKRSAITDLFTALHQAEDGMLKEDVMKVMRESGVKSSSGATLKLKAMVQNELVGYELTTSKDKYYIKKSVV